MDSKSSNTLSEVEKDAKSGSFFRFLSRFMDKTIWTLLFFGATGSACQGVMLPFLGPIIGGVFNTLGTSTTATSLSEVNADITSGVRNSCLLLVYFGTGLFFASSLSTVGLRNAGSRLGSKIRKEVFRVALQRDCTYFDFHPASEVEFIINTECRIVTDMLLENLGIYINTLATLITGLVLAFYFAWDVALVALAAAPIIVGTIVVTNKISMKATDKSNSALQRASAYAKEVLSNIRTVFSFDAGQRSAETYIKKLDAPLSTGILAAFWHGVENGALNFCSYSVVPLIIWYGGIRVSSGAYTGGDIFSVISPLLMAVMGVATNGRKIKFIPMAMRSASAIEDFVELSKETEIIEKGQTEITSAKGTLTFENVKFSYPSSPYVEVLKGVSYSVPAGTTAALVGESGCGKSTMVSLILRLYHPTSGRILLDGVDIKTTTLHTYRNHIGLVSQEPVLFATTIHENIEFGKQGASMEDVIAAAKAAQIHQFITSLPDGYNTLVGEKGTQLSGGQKQRIAIARAFLKSPKLFVLDEATSALDTQSERAIQEALRQLTAGSTTISIAHRLSTIKDSNLIIVVDKGEVKEQGTHEQLKDANGAYAALLAKYMTAVNNDDDDEEELTSEKDAVFFPASSTSRIASFESEDAKENPELPSIDSMVSKGILKLNSLTRSMVPTDGSRELDYEAKLVGGSESKSMVMSKTRLLSGTEQELVGPKKVDKKRLTSLIKEERGMVFTGAIGAAISGAVLPGIALCIAAASAAYYAPNVTQEIQKWALIMFGICIAGGCASFFQEYCFGFVGQRLAYKLRSMMMRALVRQEIGYFDEEENNSAAIISRLDSDSYHVKGQASDTWGVLAQIMGTLLCGYPISFVYCWQMTLVLTACMPAIMLLSGGLVFFTVAFAAQQAALNVKIESQSSETISNHKVVGAYNLQGFMYRSYCKKLDESASIESKNSLFMGAGTGMMMFSIFGIYALAFWYGGQLVVQGAVSFSSVNSAIFPVFLALVFIGQAQSSFPDIAKGEAASQRVFEIIDRVPAIDNSSNEGVEPESCHGTLAFKGVKFYYPQRPDVVIFRKFDLDIPHGTSVALVGPSGSGKSTIVGLTFRFYDPVAGNILLDGKQVSKLNIHWLRSQMGLVAQEPILFNGTIMDNIKYGNPNASVDDCQAAAKVANAVDFIESLPSGFNTPIGDQSIQLSGGQKQRIAIARAIIKNPRILVLDEATSALDAASERSVQEALDSAMIGRTGIVIAHRLSTVRNVTKIVVLDRGTIVEQGSHDDLMLKRGRYAKMLALQSMS